MATRKRRRVGPGIEAPAYGVSGVEVLRDLERRRRVFESLLSQFENRRLWHPEVDAPPRAYPGRMRLAIGVGRRSSGEGVRHVSRGLRFSYPEQVVRCVRRKERREVIFARGLAGKGAGSKRRERDFWSEVSC